MEFSNKCNILGQFWFEFRDDEKLKHFVEYNDVGLPLAWFISTDVVTANPVAEDFINETFNLFLSALSLNEEEVDHFENLNQIFEYLDSTDE